MMAVETIIVGAGPIGLEVAACLKRCGAEYLHFDAKQIGYTMSWWPRDTQFFSTPERIEIAGISMQHTHQRNVTGEEYLAYLRFIVEHLDLRVNTYEPVAHLERRDGGFCVTTSPLSGEKTYRCRYVVLATGDMMYPHRLGIPGEALPHVSHYFRDPHDYFRKRLLIVGGRNSAVEAALRCWRGGAEVALSYRGAEFDERFVKHFLLPDIKNQIRFGNIRFYAETTPIEIRPDGVVLEHVNSGKRVEHAADFVLMCTGFVGDTRLLEQVGATLCGADRMPVCHPDTMETDVPGLFMAGTAAAGLQQRYRLFIENCHVHAAKITQAITGNTPEQIGTIAARRYELPFSEIRAN